MNFSARLIIAKLLLSVLLDRLGALAQRGLQSPLPPRKPLDRPASGQAELGHLPAVDLKPTSVRDRSAKIHREAEILQSSSGSARPIGGRRKDGRANDGDTR